MSGLAAPLDAQDNEAGWGPQRVDPQQPHGLPTGRLRPPLGQIDFPGPLAKRSLETVMRTILLPIDFSIRSDRALRRASILAKTSGSKLRLLHVVEGRVVDDQLVAGPRPPTTGQVRERLAGIADAIGEIDGIKCESHVMSGDAVEQIAIAAKQSDTSLIVCGPHRRRLSDLITSSTAEAVAKRSKVPVLIANALPEGGYNRILVSTGLDAASAQILLTINDLPTGGPHELLAVHIREPLSTLMFDSSQQREAYLCNELESAKQDLSDFLKRYRLGGHAQPHARLNRSTIGLEIEESAAELRCDVIAIASSQKDFLEKLVAGSVGEAVVRDVNLDVLIFP